MRRSTRIRNILLVVLCLLARTQASFVVELKPDEPACYRLFTPPDRPATISGNYDVLNDRAVAVWLAMERGAGHEPTIVYQSSSDESEDVFSIGVDAGRKYVWCFEYDEEDEDDDIEPMLVGFNLRVVPVPRSLPDEEIGPDAQRALELVETAELVQNDWQNLMDHYDFLRNREGLHAELTMQIHNRVMGWTLLEASLVILMAVGQVMYWKKFFEQRRYL